jgi:hypothetical protein
MLNRPLRLCFVSVYRKTHVQASIRCISQRSAPMEKFSSKLAALGIHELPSLPSAYPDDNPLDAFRLHIAERLAHLAGVTPEAVFSGLDRPAKPDMGDFVIAVPRLRIKGAKPNELAEKWQAEVIKPPSLLPYSDRIGSLDHHRYWRKSSLLDHSCNSSSQIKPSSN